MKFKLDENIGNRVQDVFRSQGFDFSTVKEEGLGGSSDREIYVTCCREKLCLVSLDKDFMDVLRFPPQDSGGIVVIRIPKKPSLPLLEQLIKILLNTVVRNLSKDVYGSSNRAGFAFINQSLKKVN